MSSEGPSVAETCECVGACAQACVYCPAMGGRQTYQQGGPGSELANRLGLGLSRW